MLRRPPILRQWLTRPLVRNLLVSVAAVALAAGSVLRAGVANAGEGAGEIDPAASMLPASVLTLPDVPSDYVPGKEDAAIQTAQLDWLYAPRYRVGRRFEPLREIEPRRRSRRYIYIRSVDAFGNPVTQRVRARSRFADFGKAQRLEQKSTKGEWLRSQVAEKLRAAPPPPPTQGPLLLTVSLARQQITLYDQGIAVAGSPISSGMRDHPTPTGVYSVIQKQWFHRSNIYSGAPMPFMQRLTWSGIALHGGELPGYPASHGCIRLPEQFAIRLWGTTQPGVRVIITQGEVKPVEIAHAVLFTPRPKKLPEVSPSVAPPSQSLLPPVTPPRAPQVEHDAPFGSEARAAHSPGEQQTDPPLSLADEMQNTVPAIAEVAIVRGGQSMPAYRAVPSPEVSVSGMASGVRTASITIVRGGQPMQFQTVDMPPLADDAVPPSPGAAIQIQDDQFAFEDEDQNDDEDDDDAPQLTLPLLKDQPVLLAYTGSDFMQFAALRSQRRAEPASQGVSPTVIPETRPLPAGPVSVFISRRLQRLYVRKGFEAVFDAPIAIRRPYEEMGTYVFTATALTGNGAAFRWNVVALANQASGKKTFYDSEKSVRDASDTLDRLQIPADVAARISDIIQTGATLIVTDQGPGSNRALAPDNDFAVVTP